MSEKEPATVICLAKAKAFAAHPESVTRWCSVCAAEVWISKGGLAFYENDPANIALICTDCAPGVVATHGEPTWGAVGGTGQVAPISKELAEKVVASLAEDGES